MTKLELAAMDYIRGPKGYFDSACRWYPFEDEKCPLCDTIRLPSRAFPYSLRTHCRTYKHVAAKHGITVKELKQAIEEYQFDQEVMK
jgi:hypothetical protein